MMHVGEKSDT